MKYKINETKLLEAFRKWEPNLWTTQARKAHATGLSQSVVSRIESGAKQFSKLNTDQFLNVCAALNRAPHEFMELEQ